MASLDTILNLVWASLCATALAYFLHERKGEVRGQVICSRRVLSVILAAVSLFPCISATDDRVHLADFGGIPTQHSAIEQNPGHNPLSSLQLEDPEHGKVNPPLLLAFTASLFITAPPESRRPVRQFFDSPLGRAPPPLTIA